MTDVKEFLEKMVVEVKPLPIIFHLLDKIDGENIAAAFVGHAVESTIRGVYKEDPTKAKVYDLVNGKATRFKGEESLSHVMTYIIPALKRKLILSDGKHIVKQDPGLDASIEKVIAAAGKETDWFFKKRTPIPGFDEKESVLKTIYAFVVFGVDGASLEDFYDEETGRFNDCVARVGFSVKNYQLLPGVDGEVEEHELENWLVDNPMPK